MGSFQKGSNHPSCVSHSGDWNIRGPFEKFVDLRKCAAVMQRETVTVMPSCSGGGNVVVA
jgi:hypothetical protein